MSFDARRDPTTQRTFVVFGFNGAYAVHRRVQAECAETAEVEFRKAFPVFPLDRISSREAGATDKQVML